MRTRVTEMLGIKYPIVMGGMMRVGRAKLAAAVSNAGGLGIMTALTQPTPEDLLKEVARCREMTDKPFGVNLTILPTIAPVPYDEYAHAIVATGVKIVETAGRNPEPYMPMFKRAGIKVIHKCTSVRHGLKAEAIGCDIVSMDGFECAGHPGEDDTPNMVLLPCAAAKLKIPFIASGGIGNGQQLAAALALGADGVNMGTRFIATKECDVHDNVKRAIVAGNELSTVLIFRRLKNSSRVYHNSVASKVLALEADTTKTFEDMKQIVAGARSTSVYERGEIEGGIWTAGMVMGLIDDIPSCDELVRRIIRDATETVQKRLLSLVQ